MSFSRTRRMRAAWPISSAAPASGGSLMDSILNKLFKVLSDEFKISILYFRQRFKKETLKTA